MSLLPYSESSPNYIKIKPSNVLENKVWEVTYECKYTYIFEKSKLSHVKEILQKVLHTTGLL